MWPVRPSSHSLAVVGVRPPASRRGGRRIEIGKDVVRAPDGSTDRLDLARGAIELLRHSADRLGEDQASRDHSGSDDPSGQEHMAPRNLRHLDSSAPFLQNSGGGFHGSSLFSALL